MQYTFLKLPIYWILLWKVLSISQVHAKLEEAKDLTSHDNFKLTMFMVMYGGMFILLLMS